MNELKEFIILQRSDCGTASAAFSGELPSGSDYIIVARVLREDDNSVVVPWISCEIRESCWYTEVTLPEGGLYRAEARISQGIFDPYCNRYDWGELIKCVKHIGVGDVFILAGQSNMSGYGKDPAYDPPMLGVHLLNNRGEWEIAAHPLGSCTDAVYGNNDAGSATSPGLSFGRMMSLRLGIPIGLVCAAKGGSSIESWDPGDDDGYLFREMIRRFEDPHDFRALIWSQGCNETGNEEDASGYYGKFNRVIDGWYESFGKKPVVVCQINRHAYKEGGDDRFWGMVREAQRKTALERDSVFIVPTMDLFTIDGIHNSSASCVTVGERIANVLLFGYYHKGGYEAPDIRRIRKLDSRHILLEFTGNHIMRTMDDIATGINIEDKNGLMDCTGITVCREGATVEAERDIEGNAVFHAYWRREVPAFFIRDINSVPLTACYGVEIED